MNDIKSEIKKFIIDNYLRGAEDAQLSYDDSFLEKGIIDSIGVIELTSFIQEKYGIKIEVAEIIPENFDTLNNLERYTTKKLKK
ncbi:MAG: acyl carrier protein [Candidatus Omnitrophica bacterium]|nr:acyl carrier protein [Candidatus Omnitrophota bacterium]